MNISSIHTKNAKQVEAPGMEGAFSVDSVSGEASFSKENKAKKAGKDGFVVELQSSLRNEPIYGKEEKAEKSLLDEMTALSAKDLQVQRDYMTVMSNSMSDEDFAKLQKEGYRPEFMKPEEVVTSLDEIKATMAKAGTIIKGYNDDLDAATLEEITGSKVGAQAIMDSFQEAGVPATEKNLEEAIKALEMAKEIPVLSDGTKQYMVENALEPSIGNLYFAGYSVAGNGNASGSGYFAENTGGYFGKKAEGNGFAALRPQVEKIIENAGYEVNDKTVEDGMWMLEKGMALTEDSFTRYEELQEFVKKQAEGISEKETLQAIANAIADGKKAVDGNLSGAPSLLEEAVHLTLVAENASEEAVSYLTAKELPVTLRNLEMAETALEKSKAEALGKENGRVALASEESFLTAKRQLEEVRLKMTVESSYHLLKFGIKIDTMEMSRLVEELKLAEDHINEIRFGVGESAKNSEKAALFKETIGKVREIPFLPVAFVGKISTVSASVSMQGVSESITLNRIYTEGKTLQEQYATAGERYETMMTAPRSDLGDSMSKAFANVDDILEDYGLEKSVENQKAVRILGYNSMEINPKSIAEIRTSYETVHRVIEKMTPGATLDLIREGVNPLQLSMEELENRLDQQEQNPGQQAEKYSHFLYELEQNKEITPSEKEAYIGIYRLLHQIQKRDTAAIGAVMNQGAEMTLQNLLTTVRSHRNKGMDVTVDDNFGSLEEMIKEGRSITEQIEKNITAPEPETANMLRSLENVSTEAQELLKQYQIPATVEHLLTADALLKDNKLFKKMKDLEKRSTQETQGTEKEAASLEDSIFAEMSEAMEGITESMEEPASAKEAYETMANAMEKVLEQALDNAIEEGRDRIDVRELGLAFKQVNMIRRLAQEEYYEIPMQLGEEMTSVRVQFIHNKEKGGQVNISLDTTSKEAGVFGQQSTLKSAEYKLEARFEVNEKGLEGNVVSDNKETLAHLRGLEEELLTLCEKKSLPLNKINFIYSDTGKVNIFPEESDDINRQNTDSVSTRTLYETAKTFLMFITNKA